jgi:anti-sigma factor RsiW
MKHVVENIPAYLAGELDGDRLAMVEAHLESCPACRAELEEVRTTWDLLEKVEAASSPASNVWPAVRARTMGQKTPERAWFFGTGNLARTGMATAAVAAGLALGILLPAGAVPDTDGEIAATESSWLMESTWLTDSTWRGGNDTAGIDDILLGVDLLDEENGS